MSKKNKSSRKKLPRKKKKEFLKQESREFYLWFCKISYDGTNKFRKFTPIQIDGVYRNRYRGNY